MAVASPPVFEVPQRGLFDVVAANDVTSLLTIVRGDNPFDVSPGMELIRLRKRNARQAYPENAAVNATAEVSIDVAQISRTRDARGNGPAHVAASNGFVSMLEVLMHECGCAVDERNELGMTSLHMAALHGHVDCVRLLCSLGADPLSTTYCSPFTSSAVGGQTTLFQAHCARQADVVAFLQPSYQRLVTSACSGQTAAQVWEAAVAQLNEPLLALLLDAVECAESAAGPLPLTFGVDVGAGLRETLPALLTASLPADQRMTDAQLLLFERVVRCGHATAQTGLSPTETVLDRVLGTAQVQAWRVLVSVGSLQPHRCSAAAVASSGYAGNGEDELRLLIEEAQARATYARARRAYLLKGESPERRAALLSSRAAWRDLERLLQKRGVAPAYPRPL